MNEVNSSAAAQQPAPGNVATRIEAFVGREAISLNRTSGNNMARARLVKQRRQDTAIAIRAAVGRRQRPALPVRVTLTRIAPSSGLDAHDNLRGSLKPFVDGVADWLGLDDRDQRIEWVYAQERGAAYGVRIVVEASA